MTKNTSRRYRLSEEEEKLLIDFRNNTETKSNQYDQSVMSAFDDEGLVMDIDTYCEHYGLPREDITSYKLVTHTGTPFYNVVFREIQNEFEFLTPEFIQSIVIKNSRLKSYKIPEVFNQSNIVRLIFTDMHIGMHPNKEGISIYGGIWDKEEQFKRFGLVKESLICDIDGAPDLIIDNLGDMMDGLDGKTVRREHDLPQNFTNEEAFDHAVSLIVRLVDDIYSSMQFNSITINNICNSNHSASFDYMVNSTIKSILELKYKGFVKVNNYKKFINHYAIGDHTFIITHGKDKQNLKTGFKPHLDAQDERKITNYIRENKLSGFIEFSKGDSHQCLFDLATSDIFDYMNYPAFSPSSQWVQENFQKGRSGFFIQKFNKNKSEKIIKPIFF